MRRHKILGLIIQQIQLMKEKGTSVLQKINMYLGMPFPWFISIAYLCTPLIRLISSVHFSTDKGFNNIY